jgi:translation initiation factor IF-2
LGNITDGDVNKSESNHAQLIGFNVSVAPQASEFAREHKIVIKNYKIIYELINDLKAQIQDLVKPEIKRIDLGRLKVLAIFRTEKVSQIVGGKVLSGFVQHNSLAEIRRNGEIIDEGKIGAIKIGKEEVTTAQTDAECGMTYEGRPIIQVGDILEIYQEEKIYKKVS